MNILNKYEDVEKFIDVGNWFVDEVDKKTQNKNFQCSIRNKIRYHRNISVPILESVLQEYVKHFVLLLCICRATTVLG